MALLFDIISATTEQCALVDVWRVNDERERAHNWAVLMAVNGNHCQLYVRRVLSISTQNVDVSDPINRITLIFFWSIHRHTFLCGVCVSNRWRDWQLDIFIILLGKWKRLRINSRMGKWRVFHTPHNLSFVCHILDQLIGKESEMYMEFRTISSIWCISTQKFVLTGTIHRVCVSRTDVIYVC